MNVAGVVGGRGARGKDLGMRRRGTRPIHPDPR